MDLKAFEAKYTPASVAEKDKVILDEAGYALVEALYNLAENIEKLRMAQHG